MTSNLKVKWSVSMVVFTALAMPSHGAMFEFDLTNEIVAEFSNFPETLIDLGMEFTSIENSSVNLTGIFTPGWMTRVTLSDGSPHLVPSDMVNLMIRLGEPGTTWMEKDAYNFLWLTGYSGEIEFNFPLLGAAETTVPTLLPSGDLEPDLSFMLDGQFAIATGWAHTVLAAYQVVEHPTFELTEFVLQVNGTTIPEPATGLFAMLAGLALTRRCGFAWK